MSQGWFQAATSAQVMRRALKYAVVVGAILIAINHGDALLAGQLESGQLLRMALTVPVPHAVSTFGSTSAPGCARRYWDRIRMNRVLHCPVFAYANQDSSVERRSLMLPDFGGKSRVWHGFQAGDRVRHVHLSDSKPRMRFCLRLRGQVGFAPSSQRFATPRAPTTYGQLPGRWPVMPHPDRSLPCGLPGP